MQILPSKSESSFYVSVFLTAPSEPTVVPRCRDDAGTANYGQHNPQGNFCARGKTRVAGECIVARFPARLQGCVRTSLQACEEWIGGIIEDVHCSEREHWRVVIQCDLHGMLYQGRNTVLAGSYGYKPILVRTSASTQSLRMS